MGDQPMNGADFFNAPAQFSIYMQHRQSAANPNDTLEKPVFMQLLPEVQGKHILDIGCGDGGFGVELLDRHCASYTGLEPAAAMAATAKSAVGERGTIIEGRAEDWTYPPAAYDCVVSRLTLHYIADLARLFAQVFNSLKSGGTFIFSVLHPVITASSKSMGGPRQDWIVDDYFVPGERVLDWMQGQVIQYHRTVEDYFGTMQRSGFRVTALRESRPDPALFANDLALLARRNRIPLFLLMAGEKV
jgi:cyclopropane fatty-acyl-phospholipid synthase-like methyltransferase